MIFYCVTVLQMAKVLQTNSYNQQINKNGPLYLHANTLLKIALNQAGYYETSYYSVPDGYALVCRLEKIEEDGRPVELPARWGTGIQTIKRFSLGRYLRALFVAPPGYYRLIVFVVSPHSFTQSSQSISRDDAESWFQYGANSLPIDLGLQPFTT